LRKKKKEKKRKKKKDGLFFCARPTDLVGPELAPPKRSV
jgi:hypothetical protein